MKPQTPPARRVVVAGQRRPPRAAANQLLSGQRCIAVLCLTPSLALGAVYFRQNPIEAITASGLLIDRLVGVATLIGVVAVFVLFLAPTSMAIPVTGIAGTACFVVSAVMLSAGFSRGPSEPLMIGLGLVGCVVTVALTVRVGRELPSAAARAGAALLALVTAASVPLLQFWNSTSYLPGNVEVALMQELEVVKESVADDNMVSSVVHRAVNGSDVRALVVASSMRVCWWSSPDQVTYDTGGEPPDNCRDFRPVSARSWVSPHTTLAWRTTIETPLAEPLVTVTSRMAFARGDRLRLAVEPAELPVVTTECKDVAVYRVQDEARYRGVVQKDRYLVYADANGDGGLNYFLATGDSIACPAPARSALSDYYGVTEQTVIWQDWQPAVEPQTDAPATVS